MKLSKFAKLVKREAYCGVFRVENDGVWLGTNKAIYRAPGLPEIHGEEQAATILSFDEKQMDKVHLKEFDCENVANVIGYDLRDYVPGEQPTKPVAVEVIVNKKIVAALRTNVGELIFYDESILQPLEDVLKDSDYAEFTVRRAANGTSYIVVKDGFTILAAIIPVKVVTEKYISDLQEFEALCAEQLLRVTSRKNMRETQAQTSMEENDK